MPTYEYRCSNCNHELEEFQSINAKPLKKCPKCGKNTLQRLISLGGGVIFKGSGFWQTEYRSDNYKKGAEAEKKSNEAKTETKTETKSDTKTESKSETKSESKPESKPAAEKPTKTESKPAPKKKSK